MSEIIPRDIPCYCIKFRRAAGILTKHYDRMFAPFGVTANQFSLLVSIQMLGNCNKSELAQYTKMDRTAIIRSVEILMENQLIEEAKRADKKFKTMQLTKKGEEVITEGRVHWKKEQEKVESVIGEKNMVVLKEILESIRKLDV